MHALVVSINALFFHAFESLGTLPDAARSLFSR
jgi:hypothetical protein